MECPELREYLDEQIDTRLFALPQPTTPNRKSPGGHVQGTPKALTTLASLDDLKRRDAKISLLEYELRLAREDLESSRRSRVRSSSVTAGTAGASSTDAEHHTDVLSADAQTDERGALNCLVKLWLMAQGYKLTAMTMSDEVCLTVMMMSDEVCLTVMTMSDAV